MPMLCMKNIAISILILICMVSFSSAEDTTKMKDSSYFGNDIGIVGIPSTVHLNPSSTSFLTTFNGNVMARNTSVKYELSTTSISPEVRAKVAQAYGRMPLSFVENHGQMDTTVRFYIAGGAGSMFFTDKEVVMEFIKRDNPIEKKGKPSIHPDVDKSTTAVMEQRLVLRRQFLNTDSTGKLIGTQALPGKVNIMRGNDPSKWKQNITTYSEIKYQNIYPGVDIIYSGTNSNLETSIHLAPKSDINPIQFCIVGADKVKLSKTGDLEITTKMGNFTEQKPGAYQEIDGKKVVIPAKFVLKKKNTVGFEIGKYDPSLPLVIE